jgi:hypothetical protein
MRRSRRGLKDPDDFYRLLATATNIGWLSTMCDNVGHGCNGSRFTCPAG